jgi:hypothetical protein
MHTRQALSIRGPPGGENGVSGLGTPAQWDSRRGSEARRKMMIRLENFMCGPAGADLASCAGALGGAVGVILV